MSDNFYTLDTYLANNEYSFIEITPLNIKNKIKFAAFLTAYQDNFKSNWQSQEVYGRMDPIATFKNTVRTISFSFDAPSFDPVDAAMNGAKIDALIQGMYPTYKPGEKDTSILHTPPLFKIYLPSLIDELGKPLIGYMDGFSFKPKVDAGFFTITYKKLLELSKNNSTPIDKGNEAINKLRENNYYLAPKDKTSPGARRADDTTLVLPKLIQVDIVFNVLHDLPLGRNSSNLQPRELYLVNYSGRTGESNRPMFTFPHGFYDMFIGAAGEVGSNQPLFNRKNLK